MAQKIVQTQALQQVQTLSPQQVLQVRLLEMPLAELEERVKNELIDNGALEERMDAPGEDGGDTAGEEYDEGMPDDGRGPDDDMSADGGLPSDDYRPADVRQAMLALSSEYEKRLTRAEERAQQLAQENAGLEKHCQALTARNRMLTDQNVSLAGSSDSYSRQRQELSGQVSTLREKVEDWRRKGERIVFTNGCFDILHRGHAEYLHEARALGDAMIVLINSDASVRALKGPERPIIDQYNRAYMLAALESVDGVVIFDGARCDRELAALAADRYVKGGDYTREKLDPAERVALDQAGTEICFKPFIPGFSTTTIIARIRETM